MILCIIADGRSIHTQRWLRYFARSGNEVHLITYDPMGVTIKGVTEHVLKSSWNNLYLAFIPRHLECRKIVNEICPDIVHAHFITKYGFHLLGLGHYPRFVTAWGDDILILPQKSLLIKAFTRMVLRNADLVYGVSYDICDHIILDYNLPADKVEYLPFGIDTELFSPKPKEPHDTIEIYSNRGFYPVYDMTTLIDGFHLAYTEDKRLRLILRGEGPEEQKIRKRVSILNLDNVVTFLPATTNDNIPNDLQSADIFISTSISDGTPVSILEAMACELPIVTTGVGGIPEWVTAHKTGLLVPPRYADHVADAILYLTNHPEKRTEFGKAGREKVLAEGKWSTLMKKIEKNYRRFASL